MSINPVSKIAIALMLTTAPAAADVPQVVADVLPVHSLVSIVMGDLGAPELLIAPGVNPHHADFRPSQARALSNADLVVWMGEGLTAALPDRIAALADGAHVLDLSGVAGITELGFREAFHGDHDDHGHGEEHAEHDDHDHGEEHAEHDDHDHGEEHAEHDDHDHGEEHAEHDDHDHGEEHAEHDDHDHGEEHADHDHGEEHAAHDDHAGHDGHDHSGADPHMWLDPENARLWLAVIAAELGELDPDNAAIYAANADAASTALEAQIAGIAGMIDTFGAPRALVGHDAYQYFEARFGFTILGAITLADDVAPSAGRLDALRDEIAEAGAACILVEPDFNDRLVEAVASDVAIVQADPLGSQLDPGAGLYPQLIEDLALALVNCR